MTAEKFIGKIRKGIRKLKPQFKRKNIEKYIPEKIKEEAKSMKRKNSLSKGIISAIALGVGIAGVIAGIGITKVVKEKRKKRAVILVGNGNSDKMLFSNSNFNGYIIKFVDIDRLEEFLDDMVVERYKEIAIIPMYTVNGYEVERIKNIVSYKSELFEKVKYAPALLTSHTDYNGVVDALKAFAEEADDETAVVFVGKGTTHFANSSYVALGERFKRHGCKNIFVGTLSNYPCFDKIIDEIDEGGYRNILLCPLEVTVDDEMCDGIADDDRESWYSKFKRRGYNCACYMKGLCGYKGIRKIIVEHTKEAINGQ